MSIYVMSDVHGHWDNYRDFMDSANFTDQDTLFILGDVVDRGPDGIQVLQDIMSRKNVIMLMGNHELMVLPTLEELCSSNEFSQAEIIQNEVAMYPIAQGYTLTDFCQLTKKEQLKVIDYLHCLPLYKIIIVNAQKYLLVHAGLPDFNEVMDMDFYTEDELLFGPHDFLVNHFDDTIIIVGHLPTRFISGAEPDKIFKSKDTIAIDCGLGFGGQLGVLCLDTDEALYF